MRAITFALPILPGKQEAWRRCLQEMLDVYRSDYEAFRRRLAMTKVSVWLTEMPHPTSRLIAGCDSTCWSCTDSTSHNQPGWSQSCFLKARCLDAWKLESANRAG